MSTDRRPNEFLRRGPRAHRHRVKSARRRHRQCWRLQFAAPDLNPLSIWDARLVSPP
jgi:hypothetical protein